MKEIYDIINLKEKVGLVEEDATFRKQMQWYYYALQNGLVETEYDGDTLLGFLEWVRLDRIPSDIRNINLNYGSIKTGPILMATNAIATTKGVLMRLRRRVIEKNIDVQSFCWHRKRTGIIRPFKNIRSAYALSLS